MNENRYDVASIVFVPRYEYARLVAAKAKLDMIEKIVNSVDTYSGYPILKLLLAEAEEDADE